MVDLLDLGFGPLNSYSGRSQGRVPGVPEPPLSRAKGTPPHTPPPPRHSLMFNSDFIPARVEWTLDLQDIRDNIEGIWTEWFELAVTTAANVSVAPSIPRRTNQQQHRDNLPAQTPYDYYKRAVAIPLLDHLQSEMKTY